MTTAAATAIAPAGGLSEVESPITFEHVFTTHAPFVVRVVRRLGVREADVEDVAQEVFLVVHRKLWQYDPRFRLRSWLFGIASRVASDHRRRAHVRRERTMQDPPEPSSPPDQEARIDRLEARAFLDQALDTLDDDKRAVFVLYELEGLMMPEIAEAVGAPLQTAYSRLYAARDRVRAHVEAALSRRRSP